MKKYRVLLIIILLFSLTGCTTYIKDSKNNYVKYPITGQNLPSNILCKPSNADVIKIYEANKVNIKKLPSCQKLKLSSGGYEGLWNTFFVKPLAWLILKVGTIVRNYGLSLILIGLLIRLLMYPITKGTALQSEKMAQAQPEIDRIEKKYKDKTSQEEMMNKSKETMQIYQKYKINPISSCLFAFMQLPLFFAFLEAINRVPAIFEGSFLGLQLGTTPLKAIFTNGQFQYLLIVIVLGLVTYYSFKLNKSVAMNSEANKQMAFMNKFLIIFIPIASLTMSTAISLYWITSSAFTIFQNMIVKRSDK